MSLSTKQLYLFMAACSGSWRNSIYIAGQEETASGCLLAADRDGKPVILSVARFQALTGEQIDPTECRGQLTQSAFKDIFAQYLLWQLPENSTDALAL